MQPSDLQRFNHAVSLAQSGQKIEANNLLRELSRAYPNDANVWLWLVFTSTDGVTARFALDRATQIDPANSALAGARQWIQQEFPAPLVAASPAFTPVTYSAPAFGSAPPPGAQVWQNPEQPVYNQPPPEATQRTANLLTDEHKKRRGWKVMLPVLSVVGFLLLIALRIFWRMDINPFEDTSVPVYSGASALTLSADYMAELEQAMVENVNQGYSVSDIKIKTYTAKVGQKNQVVDFYFKEMKAKDWRYLKRFDEPTGVSLYYGKGKDNGALIGILEANRDILYYLGISQTHKPGDIVIVVYNFKMKK